MQRGVDAQKWGEVPQIPQGRWTVEREGGLEGKPG